MPPTPRADMLSPFRQLHGSAGTRKPICNSRRRVCSDTMEPWTMVRLIPPLLFALLTLSALAAALDEGVRRGAPGSAFVERLISAPPGDAQ
jgi:hypothetical protein